MRRFGFIAIAILALLALAAPGVSAHQASHGAPKTATFVAKANKAAPGGALRIQAKVKHPQKGATFSATATVHFATGDVTVALKRHGKSFVATGTAPVSANEAPGTVPVDVTVTYNDADQDVTTDGTVEDNQGDNNDGDDDQATCDPATTTCDDNDDDAADNGGGDGGDAAAS